MWALSIATLPIPNVGNVGMTACHPFCGFDVGYRRLNRYILTNYAFFLETMVVGPSSNGLMILMGFFMWEQLANRSSNFIDFDGFWP